MISTGGHPTFHGGWTPEMDQFAAEHEREMIEALCSAPDWFFLVTATVSVDGRAAVLFSKRTEMSLNKAARLRVVGDMVQEIRIQAGLQGIIVMGDPKSLWLAGWSHHG